ncbi:hypothetical protein GDO81_007629 [Engystomops pustulosus]|uniref:Ubiquitinyl hydrolase variant UBP zinc finger domain-containing protein n=1 Tax=Engystomops pustulosus TaxID=76066 RepID=A0AAV7C9I9_ENGPU|nr:hypothetical protein GDO81_007629 [Engystomops pustulosus]
MPGPRAAALSARNVKMAADLGELLVPYMPTIRVPKSGDRVYKTECAFSYDSPLSEGGLYVCMSQRSLDLEGNMWNGITGRPVQSVYMHLKTPRNDRWRKHMNLVCLPASF